MAFTERKEQLLVGIHKLSLPFVCTFMFGVFVFLYCIFLFVDFLYLFVL